MRRLALFALSLATATAARAEPLRVRLDRWEGRAAAVVNPGPGLSLFELTAEVAWDRAAPREPGRYSARLITPDGQATTRPIPPDEAPGARRLTFLVPAAAVRNLRPAAVLVRATVLDTTTGTEVSNTLDAGIAEFPTPRAPGAEVDASPFGWGRPLTGLPGVARPLPRPGPDGLAFVRIPATATEPGFFLATTEASVSQVRSRLKGYDPRAGRSDEFSLEADEQPAITLTPSQAETYLKALSRSDRSGITYRLPTPTEWLRAARAGRRSAFWWGDQPTHPADANFLGVEPALSADTTAAVGPLDHPSEAFRPNPWGLYHTFGNAAEWAIGPSGRYVRMGGHFRTEPASPLPDVPVTGRDATGPDPYVGLRPAFTLDAPTGAGLVRRALSGRTDLGALHVLFDPDRATATLTGSVADASARRAADRRLAGLWFLAAVEDRVEAPAIAPGQLALLGPPAGPARRIAPLGRRLDELPIRVRWADPLPVEGSEWYVNIYRAGGGHTSHSVVEPRPFTAPVLHALIEPQAGGPVSVALSLGAPAPTTADPRIVSNLLVVSLPGP